MTSPEEYGAIAQNADQFMIDTYGANQSVVLKGNAYTLGQAHDFEATFRGEEALLQDDQKYRAGIWAQLLDQAGVLRPEHRDLLDHAGDYLRGQ